MEWNNNEPINEPRNEPLRIEPAFPFKNLCICAQQEYNYASTSLRFLSATLRFWPSSVHPPIHPSILSPIPHTFIHAIVHPFTHPSTHPSIQSINLFRLPLLGILGRGPWDNGLHAWAKTMQRPGHHSCWCHCNDPGSGQSSASTLRLNDDEI